MSLDVRKFIAKSEIIVIEDAQGKKEYCTTPMSNRQIIEIEQMSIKMMDNPKEGDDSFDILSKMFECAQLRPNYADEKVLTKEEILDMPTPILIQFLEQISKLNGLDKLLDFQSRRRQGHPAPLSSSRPNSTSNFEALNANPKRVL